MAKKSQRLRRQRRIQRAKTREQEAKLEKVVEDNSVVLERMKNVSSSCDSILQNLDNANKEPEVSTLFSEPQFVSTEPVPELEQELEKAAPKVKVTKKQPAKAKTKAPAKPKAKRTTRRRRTTTTKKTSEE